MPCKIVDISKFSQVQYWDKLAESVDGIIIRCAYRGSSTGELTTDMKFKENINNAVLYDIPFGVYIYSQAIDEEEAIEEAHYVYNLIKSYKLSLPVFIQSALSTPEAKGRADNLISITRTTILKSFCNEIKALGYDTGIFVADTWINMHLSKEKITGYDIWVAKNSNDPPSYIDKYIGWQFTTNGYIPGIKGRANVSYWYREIEKDIPIIDQEPKIEKITTGEEVVLNGTNLYPTASSTYPDTVKTGLYYIWNDAVAQNKVRITASKDNVNIPGMITGWVKLKDIMEYGDNIPEDKIVKIISGNKITLENAKFYKDINDDTATSIESGEFYIWSSAIINKRIRICNNISDVGVMGKVVAWISLDDL